MKKFLRMIVLTVVLMAQLLAGISVGASDKASETEGVEALTALSLLKAAETVVTEETEWGPSIKSINGTEIKGTDYWGFYVNGDYAQEGAGTYKPKVGDVLTFKYETYPVIPTETTTEETIKIVGLESDSTALSLLQKVENVELEEYDWGPMITSINGKEANDKYWWSFSINGTPAFVGAGGYRPKHGDVLSFKYTLSDPDSNETLPNIKYTIAALQNENNNPPEGEKPIENCENPLNDSKVERAAKWVQISETGVDQTIEALAIRHLEKAIPQSFFDKINNEIETSLINNEKKKVANYHNYILSLILNNQDPSNLNIEGNNYNLVEKIYNNPETGTDIYSLINALIAIDSKDFLIPEDALWNREKIISAIIDNRNAEGLWSWSKKDPADIDTTAMVLTALAPYKNKSEMEDVIEKAVNWLSSIQLYNGGFNGGFGENASTAAYVLTALTALEVDPKGDKFTKPNGSLVDNISTYILEDGSFSSTIGGETDEVFATPQGLLALVSYERFLQGKGSVYDLSELPLLVIGEINCSSGGTPGGTLPTTPGENKKQTITISVRTHESTILSPKTLEVNEGATALSALVDELGGRVKTSGSGSSGYVIAIDGLAEFDHGPTSGWKYSVNGYFPSGGAGTYRLNNGDQLEWVYVTEDKDAANEKASMGGSAATAKPDGVTVAVFESFEKIKADLQKQNAVLNKDQKMSSVEAQKLKEALNANTVKVEKTIVPTEETVIASPKVDEVKIVIPKEALKEQKTIKIEELAPSTTNIEGNLKSSVYQFLPKGIKFEKPVYISINIPIEDDDLDNLVMAWFDEEKKQWIPIPTVIDAKTGTLTGQVDHFTKFAVIDNKQQNKLDMTAELEKLVQHLQTDKTQSEWEDFGMARLGKADNQAVLNEISKVIKEANGYFRKITDYERYVLTVKALGGDPTNIGGYDLIEKIYNNERMTMQGTNGLIFALIALDSGNYQVPSTAKWNREKILANILTNQNKDGGFSLVNGDPSDVDITAMAISSLVNYKDIRPEVKTAIDKAVNWLSSVQQASGGFIADGKENSESASQVIIALASAGIDPQGPSFTKANGNVVENLLSYQSKDGGFANLKNEKSNQIASEQALLALLALDHYSKNLPSIYQFANQEIEKEVATSIPDFADVDQISDYALQSIYNAFDKGVMVGVEQNPLRFAPKQNLTRAQFTAILVDLLEGEVSEQSKIVFKDVLPGQWYYNVVMKANELGIVRGTSNTTFSPNDPITREQVAIILARAFDLMAKENEPKTAVYNDIASLSPYNQAAIQALYDHNLMKGYEGGQFKPKNYVTREMGAVIAIRLSEKAN